MILHPKRLRALETDRLRLEPLSESDATSLFPIMGDPDVMASWDLPEVDDPDVVARIVRDWVEDLRAGRAARWAVRTLAGGEFLGCAILSEIDRRQRKAELGFLMGREAWDAGVAQEAMPALVAFAASRGLRRLGARSHLGARMEALLLQFGFAPEGLLRGQTLKDGERRDSRVFGLSL